MIVGFQPRRNLYFFRIFISVFKINGNYYTFEITMAKENAFDPEKALEYYDKKFSEGYSSVWPEFKQNRNRNLLKEIPFPAKGRALDFGCGYAVNTKILKEVLADWEVCGADISDVGLANARKNLPGSNFYKTGSQELTEQRFDFIFTHHVLEHVPDLQQTANLLAGISNPGAYHLHIMPCRNPGSLENDIALMTKGGILPEKGNTYHSEDESHLMRLTSDELESFFNKAGLTTVHKYFSGHYYGSLKTWYELDGDSLDWFVNPVLGINEKAIKELTKLNRKLKRIRYVTGFAQLGFGFLFKQLLLGFKTINPKKIGGAIYRMIIFPYVSMAGNYWLRKEEREWKTRRNDPAGNEMFILFKKEK